MPNSRLWFVVIVSVIIIIGSTVSYLKFSLGTQGSDSHLSTSLPVPTSTVITSRGTSSTSLTQTWLTYHNGLSRNGLDSKGPSVSNFTPKFGWRSATLDGTTYAEPLIDDGKVIVATENDSIYALS